MSFINSANPYFRIRQKAAFWRILPNSINRVCSFMINGLILCVISAPNAQHSANSPVNSRITASPFKKNDNYKWKLWSDGPYLRGANIYQARVYPELDGLEFKGPGPVGPPYIQEDFNRLAALGANYVNISHPGLFTENPPYSLDTDMQNNLDELLMMIQRANMFAVICFRTGPGRSEFTFMLDEVGSWFDESYLNDRIWKDRSAQNGWCNMWRHTAERYRDHPIVVGYDLMVEPNANDVWLDIWDAKFFYTHYSGTLYDWNQLAARITTDIREVDQTTPILVGGMAYSSVEWLPSVKPTGDPLTVYIFHQYAPFDYTHQYHPYDYQYPGFYDFDWDNIKEPFDKNWLDDLLATVDAYMASHNVPVTVNEFGVHRWLPGAAQFMDDQMDLFEQRCLNHALWLWNPSWPAWTEEVNDFDFTKGPDPDNYADVIPNDLYNVILKYWARNEKFPLPTPVWSGSSTALKFTCCQNYPNPFNASTTFRFSLPMNGYVTLNIVNLTGQTVAPVISTHLSEGEHEILWTASGLSSGLYYGLFDFQPVSPAAMPVHERIKLLMVR